MSHRRRGGELASDLASAKALRAGTLIDLGEVAKGVKEGREAVELLRAEVARTGSAYLQQVLNWLTDKLRPFEGQADFDEAHHDSKLRTRMSR